MTNTFRVKLKFSVALINFPQCLFTQMSLEELRYLHGYSHQILVTSGHRVATALGQWDPLAKRGIKSLMAKWLEQVSQ